MSLEKESEKAFPFTIYITVLSDDNLDQVCVTLHGNIWGLPRALLFDNLAETAFQHLTQL